MLAATMPSSIASAACRETRPPHRAVDPGGIAAIPPAAARQRQVRSWSATGIKIPKCGRKMPAVKLLHQQFEANTKPEYITGCTAAAVSLLVQAASSFFSQSRFRRAHP